MSDKFCVTVLDHAEEMPRYFNRFYQHCAQIADRYGWDTDTVMNTSLKPLGGRVIKTKTQGWYLRWDDAASHTAFVLRWA